MIYYENKLHVYVSYSGFCAKGKQKIIKILRLATQLKKL